MYATIDKEIVELSLSRYKKAEHFADDYAKDHKPSYIKKKEWEILHNESIETINQNCETTMREFEKWHFCTHVKVQFSDEDLCEIKKKYNISIIEDDLPEIKILKI